MIFKLAAENEASQDARYSRQESIEARSFLNNLMHARSCLGESDVHFI